MALDKLVDSTQLDGAMTATANALRTKGGTSAQIAWDNTYGFKAAVEALTVGGVIVSDTTDTHGGTIRTITSKSTPILLQEKTNITPGASSITVTPDTGYDGMSSVQINAAAGGASNVVTGSFTATTLERNSNKTITLGYTGSGYPISVAIYPKEGSYNSSSDFYSLLHKYAVWQYFAVKNYIGGDYGTPTYTGAPYTDRYCALAMYKNNDSTATSSAEAASKTYAMANAYGDPSTSVVAETVVLASATSMKVRIASNSSGSYGFTDGIEYEYVVTYSS